MTLLEQARKIVEKSEPEYAMGKETIEQGELMIAWIAGEVTGKQVATVLGIKAHHSIGMKVGPILRELARFKRLSIKILPEPKA